MRRLIALFIVSCVCSLNAQTQAQTETLQSGIPIERSLARGQSHTFNVTLEADQFLQVVVNQKGIDVIVRAFAPDGTSLGEFDSPNGAEGPEPVPIVAVDAGSYRFEVAPLGQREDAPPGRYEIKIVELRKATEQELQASKNPELLRARGFALLTEVADSLSQIRLPQTRVRAQLLISGLLQPSDEKLAAKIAADAAEGVKEFIAGADPLEPDYYQTYELAMQLRQEVVQVMAQTDPEAALAFIKATATLSNPAQHHRMDRELYLELMLANHLASKDPLRAVQAAEESLKKGYSPALIELVSRLRSREPELASRLAKQIVSRLQNEKLLKNQEASNLAIGMLRLAHAQSRRFQSARSAASAPKNETKLLSDQEYKELFDKTLTEALAYNGPAGNQYSPEKNAAQTILNALKGMSSEMQGYAPQSVPLIEKRLVELNAPSDPQSAQWEKYNQAINAGTLEEGLETVSRAPSEMRDQLYQQVAQRAVTNGDVTRARQILRDHISNTSQRQQALSQLEQQVIYLDAAKGRIEEALRAAGNLRTLRQRASVVGQIANQIGTGQKRATALELLEQARSLLGSSVRVENLEQMGALMEIARITSRYDSKRAFEMVEPLIDQFNEVAAAALVLNGFGQQYYENGELAMQNGSNVANFATQLFNVLGSLGRSNFDRAKADADRFERPEVRINALLLIAQHAIGGDPNERRSSFRRGRAW